MTATTRRRVLVSAAAALAMSGAAIDAAAPDPIFAVIERYRRAGSACDEISRLDCFMDNSHAPDQPIGRERSSELILAAQRVRVARHLLARTVPTTREGLLYLLEYVDSTIRPGDDWLWDGEHQSEVGVRSIVKAARRLL